MSENDLKISESDQDKVKLDEKFLIKVTDPKIINIERNVKNSCKIMKISSHLDTDQKLNILSTLDALEYPNLFIFIIEDQKGKFEDQTTAIEKALCQFGSYRPLIIQVQNPVQMTSKFYHKRENSNEIVNIEEFYTENLELYEYWINSIDSLLDLELDQFEDDLLKKLSFIKDSSIILRFLRASNLEEAFFGTIVLKIAENGSKAELLAVLDSQFETEGRMLNNQAQKYLKLVFEGDDSDESVQEFDIDLDDQFSQSTSLDSNESVLQKAVQHLNQEIIDFLITYWSPLIQELPIEHRIKISTIAYDLNRFDILCSLLEVSDFPFPRDFTFTKSKIDTKLLQITETRMDFKVAIEREDYDKLNQIIRINLNSKMMYNINNNSALTEAVRARQYGVFYYLKSLGYKGENCEDILVNLKPNDKKAAVEKASEQRKTNISLSLPDFHKSVYNLSGKSLIHNRKITKMLEMNYRDYIMKWLKDIHKIAPEMLEVAASCDDLMIIFDFESYSAENASLDNSNALGTTFSGNKWIFIGAKFTDKAMEQKIKGVLAHELCHYVMNMVYENHEFPYFKGQSDVKEIFSGIVVYIDKWSKTKEVDPDDECEGIISVVFRSYLSNDFEPELIVRVVNILAHFDDDQEKVTNLQNKYKILFEYWHNFVVREMKNYLKKEKVAIRINSTVGLLSAVSSNEIECMESKDMDQLIQSKITIVTTNVPKLLLINIYEYLKEKYKCFLKSQNLFLEPCKIRNEQVWKDLKDLYGREVNMNVFVDCTKDKLEYLGSILKIKDFKFILIVSNEQQCLKLKEICYKRNANFTETNIYYKWSDLTRDTQILLLQTEVIFQNNNEIEMLELLSKNENPSKYEIQKIINEIPNIINDHLFNLLIDKKEISINALEENLKVMHDILFQKRSFIKKRINFKNKISQENLISINSSNKYVLISDIAGSGKSWVVKNISKIFKKQNPTKWVTHVDLKQFIKEFKLLQGDFEFLSFFVQNFLKSKNEYEGNIFKKLYSIGKVLIFLDGFDEIAPDCAEIVANLAKSFEFNDGNQMWIITRDYFEVDLQKTLNINTAYRLDEFSEEDGMNFIVSSWILQDYPNQTVNDFEYNMQNSPNVPKYKEKAKQIVSSVVLSKNKSIGLPQLFSMIADSFKDDQFSDDDLKGAKIFIQFVNTMYTRWTYHKGIFRKEANIRSLDYEMNFKEVHQYFAILNLYPEYVESLFPDYNKNEWPETEIIACGFMNKVDSCYVFNHETFCEFFVADFIFKALKKQNIKKEVFDILIKILTVQKYAVIRMFLDDFSKKLSDIEKFERVFEKYTNNFLRMENLSEFFIENQKYLASLVIDVLKNRDYESVKTIITQSFKPVTTKTKLLKMFSIFIDFAFTFLNKQDLMNIISDQNIIHEIIQSELDIRVFDFFVSRVEEKIGEEFIQQELIRKPESIGGNIFYCLASSESLSETKVRIFFDIIQGYISESKIVELMFNCTPNGLTLLHILIKHTDNFRIFFGGADCIFAKESFLRKFKFILWQHNPNRKRFLHLCAKKQNVDFHESIWNVLKKSFDDQKELMVYIQLKNKFHNNFLHFMIMHNTSEVIKLTLKKFKEILDNENYFEILKSKGELGRNLPQMATIYSKEIKTHEILWTEIKNNCHKDEFLKIIEEIDEQQNNIIYISASVSSGEIFAFIHSEIVNNLNHDKIKNLFLSIGNLNRNLLQAAAIQNKHLDLHKYLWEIFSKYFNFEEICEFIKNCDIYGNNLLLNLIDIHPKEVVSLIWEKLKEILINNHCFNEKYNENIQKCDNLINNTLGLNLLKIDEKEFLKFKWTENEHPKLINQIENESILCKPDLEYLKQFIADNNIEHHKHLWKVLLTKSYDDIKMLLLKKDFSQNIFLHHIVMWNSPNVIEFSVQKLKENFKELDYQEILKSKGEFRKNVLHFAASVSKEVRTHQFLWSEFQSFCSSNDEFFEILNEVDENGHNLFHLAASATSDVVFLFMEKELTKFTSRYNIRNLFAKLGFENRNLLHYASFNKRLDFHKVLWIILQKYFNPFELLEFIKHMDINSLNAITFGKLYSSKEVINHTWREIKDILLEICKDTETVRKIQMCENAVSDSFEGNNNIKAELFLFDWIKDPDSQKSIFLQNFIQKNLNFKSLNDILPIVYNKNPSDHYIFWDHFQKAIEHHEDLIQVITDKNRKHDNFIHLIVTLNTSEVIKITLNKLKEIVHESKYQIIMKITGQFGRNLLQLAVVNSKEIKTFKFLWNEFQNIFKSEDSFLKHLEEIDDEGNDFLHLTSIFTNGEVLEFIQKDFRKKTKENIKLIISKLGFRRQNLMQSAVLQNETIEFYNQLWKMIEEYFNTSEILNFIKHCDVNGNNIILNVIKNSTKDIKEMTWNKVLKLLESIGYKNNGNLKLCDNIIRNNQDLTKLTKEDEELLKLIWITDTNTVNIFEDNLTHRISNFKNLKDLLCFTGDKNIKNHEILWKHIEENYKNYEDLKNLIFEKDKNGNNFIHLLISHNTAEIVKLTLNIFKENFNESDFKEILRSRGQYDRNLQQKAACQSLNIKVHQILWTEIKKTCKSKDEFLEIFEEVDSSSQNIFHIAAAHSSSEIFEFILAKIKIVSNDLKSIFLATDSNNMNLMQHAALKNRDENLHKTIWKIVKKIFTFEEIIDFIQNACSCCDEQNLLIKSIFNPNQNIKIITWREINEILTSTDLIINFKDMLIEICENIILSTTINISTHQLSLLNLKWINNGTLNKILLELSVNFNLTVHNNLWKYLNMLFESSEKLRSILSGKIKDDCSFIQLIVIDNSAEVIELTIQKIFDNFDEIDSQKILRLKGQYERNLLQLGVGRPIEIQQCLWKTFRNYFKSENEFLDYLNEKDEDLNNIFGVAALYSSIEYFNFVQKALKSIKNKLKIRELLINLDINRQHLLLAANQENKSYELHESIWEILEFYFESSEILQFIKHRDIYGNNILGYSIDRNTKEVLKLTWKKIKITLSKTGYKSNNKFLMCDKIIKNISSSDVMKKEDVKLFKLNWIDCPKSADMFKNSIESFLENLKSNITLRDLKLMVVDDDICNHYALWKFLEDNLNNYEEMKNLLFGKNSSGENYIHLIICCNTSDIIELTMKKLKKNLTEIDFRDMLKSKGGRARNLLHQAAAESDEVKTLQILWKAFQDCFKSEQEFSEILIDIDEEGDNVFYYAAAFSSYEIFEFITSEIEKLKNKNFIRQLLSTVGAVNQNILQIIAIENNKLESHKLLWKMIFKYFDEHEILEFIEHCDEDGDNLLCCSIYWNTNDIVEFTWNNVKQIKRKYEDQIEYLTRVGHHGNNLLQFSLKNKANDERVAIWAQQIVEEYGINM